MGEAGSRTMGFRAGRSSFLVAAPALGDEAVAHPGLGLNVLFAGFGIEFLAQLADKDAQVLRLVSRLRSPDGGEQGAMGHDLSRVAGQVEQQVELLGGEMDGFADRKSVV